ncbi:hypothetical protein ACLOJK_030606 [Asimina triloba]
MLSARRAPCASKAQIPSSSWRQTMMLVFVRDSSSPLRPVSHLPPPFSGDDSSSGSSPFSLHSPLSVRLVFRLRFRRRHHPPSLLSLSCGVDLPPSSLLSLLALPLAFPSSSHSLPLSLPALPSFPPCYPCRHLVSLLALPLAFPTSSLLSLHALHLSRRRPPAFLPSLPPCSPSRLPVFLPSLPLSLSPSLLSLLSLPATPVAATPPVSG